MANNKLRYELELDSSGYSRGAQQASYTTKELKKSTEDYIKEFGPLRKQLKAAKKETEDLAGQFAMLSKAEKQSEFGKSLKEELNIAIEKSAELQDVLNDTHDAIKKASSDTATWDSLKEGIDVTKSATLAYAAAVAQVTGNEEDLAKMVKTLATIENTFNAAIKIGNALQQQSALMTGIRRLQTWAAGMAEEMATEATVADTAAITAKTVAEKASTAATATGTKTVKAATLAQAAFNKVANMNPYVILATVAIAATAAIAGYVNMTKKATEEEKAAQREKESLEQVNKKYYDTYGNKMVEMITKYKQMQAAWTNLKSEHEKNQFIKDNKAQFDEYRKILGKAATEEDILKKYTADIKQAFIQRAKAAATAAAAVEMYSQAYNTLAERQQKIDERDAKLREARKDFAEYEKMSAGYAKFARRAELEQKYGFKLGGKGGLFNFGYEGAKNQIIKEYNEDIDAMKGSYQGAIAQAEKLIDKSIELGNELDNTGKKGDKVTKEQVTHLGKLNNKLDELNKKKKNINPVDPKAVDKLKELNAEIIKTASEIKDYELMINFNLSKESYNQLREYSNKIDEIKIKIKNLDPKLPDYKDQLNELKKQLRALESEANDFKLKVGIELEKPNADVLETWKNQKLEIEAEINPVLDETKAEAIWDKIRAQEDEIKNLQIQYDAEIDPQKKIEILKEINGIYDYIKQLKAKLNVGIDQARAKRVIKEIDSLREEADKLEEVLIKPDVSATDKAKTDDKLKQIYDRIAKLLGNIPIGLSEESLRKFLSELDELDEKIEQREISIGIKPQTDALDEWANEQKEIELELNPKVDKKQLDAVWENINSLKSEADDLLVRIRAEMDPQKKQQLLNDYKNLISQLEAEQLKLNTGISPASAKYLLEQLDDLRQQADDLETLKLNPELDENKKAEVEAKLKAIYETIATLLGNIPIGLDEESLRNFVERYNELADKINQRKIELGIEVKADVNAGENKVKEVLDKLFNKEKPEYNFEFIPEAKEKEANKLLGEYKDLKKGREELQKVIDDPNSKDKAIDDATKGIDKIDERIGEIKPKLDDFQKDADKNEAFQGIAAGAKAAGQYIGQLGDVFSALGDATENDGLKAVGIIAQTLANLALSFSQAMLQAGGQLGPWGWIAFGIAGMAQLAAMIAQIKNLTAGSYAQGGIIQGNSYHGDKLLANVNSGEMIFNQSQQKRLLDIANGIITPASSNDIGDVEFVIAGRRLVGVMNNELKTNRKQTIG